MTTPEPQQRAAASCPVCDSRVTESDVTEHFIQGRCLGDGLRGRPKYGDSGRLRAIQRLAEQPTNTGQLSDDLDVARATARYRLEILEEAGAVERSDDEYRLTDQAREGLKSLDRPLEEIADEIDRRRRDT